MISQAKNLFIHPSGNFIEKTVYLDESQKSWVRVSMCPDELCNENFERLFSLHPEQKGKVLCRSRQDNSIYREIDAHRWYKSYLSTPPKKEGMKSYMFSGLEDVGNENLSKEFQPFLDYVNQEKKYNQVVVNWYLDGNDYLPFHYDWDDGMTPNSDIATITLMDPLIEGASRTFCFKPNKNTDSLYDYVQIPTINGVIILMGGQTNQKFRHGIPKESCLARRISITFRSFL